jgi:hypothetical protein
MRLVLRIMETESAGGQTSDSGSSLGDEEGSLELMRQVKEAVLGFAPVVDGIGRQIESIKGRALASQRRSLLTDRVFIRSPAIAEWLETQRITVADFVRKVMENGTMKTDLETRAIWLQPDVAEMLGLPFGQRVAFFEFLRLMPRWLDLS